MAARRTFDCACIALMCSLTLGVAVPAAHAKKPRKTIARELNKLYLRGAIDEPTYAADRAVYKDVKRRIRHLSGTRQNELRGVLRTVQGIAARGSLRASRLYPLFLTLQRNAEWWSTQPLLASGQRVTFEDSELIWQYVPGQGLQFHPLANFGRLNAYARNRRQRFANEQMLDELMAMGVPRGGGLAWEYYFAFDGGRPPWVSGLAQGTALQAIARSAAKLDRMPELLPRIQQGLELFEREPPTGVRVETEDGVHYAQYSFWPSLHILNGFVQSLVGLYDVAQITGDVRAAQIYADGERSARAEVPRFDTGAWSYYSRGAITRESDLHYHTLLRDFLANL
jgi:D-glucuronyl C5-epimerase C-terminus